MKFLTQVLFSKPYNRDAVNNLSTSTRFKLVYDRYFEAVFGTVARYHPQKVEDITAEIFEKRIFKAVNRGYFQNEDDTGLAIDIAKKYCCSVYQKEKKQQIVSFDESVDLSKPNFLDTPSQRINLMMDLQHAMSYLTDKQKTVMLFTMDGYKDQEIANQMSTTVGSVRMLRKRARTIIKKFLKD